MLCLIARGDSNKMKDCFVTMLTIDIPGENDAEENEAPRTATYTDKVLLFSYV
jgi:intraflagellar transport protein 88